MYIRVNEISQWFDHLLAQTRLQRTQSSKLQLQKRAFSSIATRDTQKSRAMST